MLQQIGVVLIFIGVSLMILATWQLSREEKPNDKK